MDLSPLLTTLKVAGVATLFTVVIGTLLGYFLPYITQYLPKWVNLVIELWLTLPLVLPPTVVGFGLLVVFGASSPLGELLDTFGLPLMFTWQGGAVACFVVSLPLVYRTARASFGQIDPDILRVGRTLGLSEWRIFIRIALPTARTGLYAGGGLGLARSLGEFGATMMFAGNLPGQTQTISVQIYTAVQSGQIASAWAWSGVMVGLSLLCLLVVHHFETKENGYGAGG